MTLNSLPVWPALQAHYEEIRDAHLRDWFAPANDRAPTRAERFTFEGGGLAADFSKNRLTDATLALLVRLAREAGVEARRDAMFAGETVNPTEGRAALHTALRANAPDAPFQAQVAAERAKMARFADAVRSGAWTGYTGKRIRHVVNIGIGGSDLGPKMVVHALHHVATPDIATHFVSNVDGADLARVLERIDPEATLAIIVSKTFTTLETMTNARSLRDWFVANGCPEGALAKHFVGVSANPAEVVKFGIAEANVFEMWDWVGGRYSLWSAVGLSIMIAIGPERFDELLAGARDMDEHFRTAPLERNLPVLQGLVGIWYRNFFGAQSYLVAPYSEALHYLPSYLQQLEMESNGKSARIDGAFVDYPTSAVTWGEPGTNGQHAFFQMLHQGPTLVPIDFIAVLTPEHPLASHHPKLPRQPADDDAPRRRAHAAHARRADCAVRAQGARTGGRVEHQSVRPMGRRARQDPGQSRRGGPDGRAGRSGEARFVDIGADRARAEGARRMTRGRRGRRREARPSARLEMRVGVGWGGARVARAHGRIGTSAHRHIGASAHRRIGTSAHRRIGASAHRRIGASAHRHAAVWP